MKSKFKMYVIVWAAVVVLFNVIVFITPNEVAGMSKFGGAFWVGYAFIMILFLAQLGIGWYAIKDDLTKTFYNIPLLQISYSTMIAMLVVGVLCMTIPQFPVWLGIIICLLVVGFGGISAALAQTASSVVSDIDVKVKNKTFFIRSLTVDIESLLTRSELPEVRDEVNKVYEAVRYSDPTSNEALSGVEAQITLKVSELADAIEKSDIELAKKTVREMVILLNDRNKKCKLLK